ncbi:amino acid ABC transporter ATP-binding protein [Paralimibaculum aggregatum]|uniref:Amino acid ABC transporter ATP-binding protein n=1 Tax=Paralimibaculum aggregatum TaxID=3036245 RepID=A0ABQ6LSY3_9RHOB|nr:amino acid ABC transporter ATP-binding protein [Limibaculum sp. NKW23]GMG85195.1 amino acid ABC transporter ATP-binding protein [Limibaculum sp. NKW23]
MTAVEFTDVNKWYDNGLHALRDINLSVNTGETVVICGPSGSGKSTLIRTVNALEPIDTGQIAIAGTPVQMMDRRSLRRRVGMVFQSFNLFTHFKVLDNLTLAAEHVAGLDQAAAEARAMQLLDRVGLADQAQKYPGQLSGGQQQRVAIARTLMLDPDVLLFDEPTSALDPEMIAEVLSLMEDLAREGRTMLCVTHEMGFARNVADQIVFMAHGSVIEKAPPAAFFDNPQTMLAQAFLSKII